MSVNLLAHTKNHRLLRIAVTGCIVAIPITDRRMQLDSDRGFGFLTHPFVML